MLGIFVWFKSGYIEGITDPFFDGDVGRNVKLTTVGLGVVVLRDVGGEDTNKFADGADVCAGEELMIAIAGIIVVFCLFGIMVGCAEDEGDTEGLLRSEEEFVGGTATPVELLL